MKMTTLALLSILLSSLSTNPLLRANELQVPVKDVAGESLQRWVDYYILPAVHGQGGGVIPGRNRNSTSCPLNVVQEQQEVQNGLPVTFSPVDQNQSVIREGTDMNIKFSVIISSCCMWSSVWKLGDFNKSVTPVFVTTGGIESNLLNPGSCNTSASRFLINSSDETHDYKFVFCPAVCDVSRPFCGDIGIFVDNQGIRRLAISKEPFRVRFKRAF